MIKNIRQHLESHLDYYLLGLMALLGFYLDLSLKRILFLVVLVWVILNPVSLRTAALVALLTAIAISLLLLVKQPGLAEQTSIGLFMLLVYLIVGLIAQATRRQQ